MTGILQGQGKGRGAGHSDEAIDVASDLLVTGPRNSGFGSRA